MKKYKILFLVLMIFLGSVAILYSVRGYLTNDKIQTGYLELTGEEGYYVDFDEDDVYDSIQLHITGEDKEHPEGMTLLFNRKESNLWELLNNKETTVSKLEKVYVSELNWSDDFVNLLIVFCDETSKKHTAIVNVRGKEVLLLDILEGFPEENFVGDGYFQIREKTPFGTEEKGHLYLEHTFFIEEEKIIRKDSTAGYMEEADGDAESYCRGFPVQLSEEILIYADENLSEISGKNARLTFAVIQAIRKVDGNSYLFITFQNQAGWVKEQDLWNAVEGAF